MARLANSRCASRCSWDSSCGDEPMGIVFSLVEISGHETGGYALGGTLRAAQRHRVRPAGRVGQLPLAQCRRSIRTTSPGARDSTDGLTASLSDARISRRAAPTYRDLAGPDRGTHRRVPAARSGNLLGRAARNWLLDGHIPVPDLKDRLDLDEVPEENRGRYHTLSGHDDADHQPIAENGRYGGVGGWRLEPWTWMARPSTTCLRRASAGRRGAKVTKKYRPSMSADRAMHDACARTRDQQRRGQAVRSIHRPTDRRRRSPDNPQHHCAVRPASAIAPRLVQASKGAIANIGRW